MLIDVRFKSIRAGLLQIMDVIVKFLFTTAAGVTTLLALAAVIVVSVLYYLIHSTSEGTKRTTSYMHKDRATADTQLMMGIPLLDGSKLDSEATRMLAADGADKSHQQTVLKQYLMFVVAIVLILVFAVLSHVGASRPASHSPNTDSNASRMPSPQPDSNLENEKEYITKLKVHFAVTSSKAKEGQVNLMATLGDEPLFVDKAIEIKCGEKGEEPGKFKSFETKPEGYYYEHTFPAKMIEYQPKMLILAMRHIGIGKEVDWDGTMSATLFTTSHPRGFDIGTTPEFHWRNEKLTLDVPPPEGMGLFKGEQVLELHHWLRPLDGSPRTGNLGFEALIMGVEPARKNEEKRVRKERAEKAFLSDDLPKP